MDIDVRLTETEGLEVSFSDSAGLTVELSDAGGAGAFDLHEDVTEEMTAPAGADRLVASDESAAGAPNKFLTLTRLKTWLQNNFALAASKITSGTIDPARLPPNVGASESTEAAAKAGSGDGSDRMSARRTKDAIDAQAVRPEDFEPETGAYWVNYGSGFDVWDGTETGHSASFFTGAPSASTLVSFPNVTPKDITGVTRVRIRKNVRSDADYFGDATKALAQPSDTAPIRFVPYDSNAPVATFTPSAVTSGGSGAAAWWEITGTMAQTANWNPGGAAYLRVTGTEIGRQRVPEEQLDVNQSLLIRFQRLPAWGSAMASGLNTFIASAAASTSTLRNSFASLLTSVFAKLDASNLTVQFKSDVQGPSEPYTVTADQTRVGNTSAVASDGAWRVVSNPVVGGGAVGIVWRLDAVNYPEVLARWGTHKRIQFPAGAVRIEGGVNELGNRTLQANIVLLEGALPAVNGISRPVLRGVPTWGDVRDSVRDSGADDDHLVTEKAVADHVGGKPDPEDTVPFAASFRDKFEREFKSGLTGNDTGEATVSSDNTVPSGAPAGTTAFVAMDQADESGTDQTASLSKIAVGDWMRAKRGDKYIIARISYIKTAVTGEFEFWFVQSDAEAETLQYDELPDGDGEIRFYRKGSGDSLPDQSGHSGQFLKTDGTTADWADAPAGGGGGGGSFDLHEDVTTEMTAPAGADRLVASDESVFDDPNRWLTLTRLKTWLETNLGLAASKITSGTLAAARIPGLAASKITSGTLAAARIPGLAASKITSGTLSADRLPDASTSAEGIVELATTAEMTAGTASKIPDASKVKTYVDANAGGGGGGLLTKAITGDTTLTDAEAKNAAYKFTGTITGSIPAGLYMSDRTTDKIYKSTDFGATWDAGVAAPSTSAFGMAFHGTDLYVSDSDTDKIYKSTDYGATWNVGVAVPSEVRNPADMTFHGNDLYLMGRGTRKIYKSTDYGATWDAGVAVPSAETNPYSLAFHGNDLYLAGITTGKIYKSTDYGATWNAGVTGPSANPTGIAFLGNDLYAVDPTTRKVYKSTDYGATWNDGVAVPSAATSPYAIALTPAVAATATVTIPAAGAGAKVIDDETTGTLKLKGPTQSTAIVALSGSETYQHDGAEIAVAAPPPPVATTTVKGVVELATQAEMDAGTASKIPDASKVKTYVDANAPAGLLTKAITGNVTLTDAEALNTAYRFTGTLTVDHTAMFLVGSGSSRIHKSFDNGATWFDWVPEPNLEPTPYGLAFHGSDIYLIGANRRLMKSTDNGATWLTASTTMPASESGPRDIAFHGDNLYLVGITTDKVYKSTDYGSTWDAGKALPSAARAPQGIAFHGNDLYLTDSSARLVYKSTDYGSTWDAGNGLPTATYNPRAVAFEGDTLYLTDYATRRIYKSTDYGATWDAGVSIGIEGLLPEGLAFRQEAGATVTIPAAGAGAKVITHDATGTLLLKAPLQTPPVPAAPGTEGYLHTGTSIEAGGHDATTTHKGVIALATTADLRALARGVALDPSTLLQYFDTLAFVWVGFTATATVPTDARFRNGIALYGPRNQNVTVSVNAAQSFIKPVINLSTGTGTVTMVLTTGQGASLVIPAGVTGGVTWIKVDATTGVTLVTPTDAEIGDKAFSNPPGNLTNTEKSAVRTRIGAGTSSFSGSYTDLTNKPAIPDPVPDATTTTKGKVELATQTEMNAGTANKVPDAAKVKAFVDVPNTGILTKALTDDATLTAAEARNGIYKITGTGTGTSQRWFLTDIQADKLYRSINEGASWSDGIRGGGSEWFQPRALATHGKNLYLADDFRNKIFKSVDYGDTWDAGVAIPSAQEHPQGIAFHGNTLYMAGSSPDAIYKSANYGATWDASIITTLPNGNVEPGGIAFHGDRLYLLDTNSRKIFSSGDFGATWDAGVAVPSAETAPRDISIYGGALYLVGDTTNKIYKSTNFGAAWDSGSATPSSNPAGFAIGAGDTTVTITVPAAGAGVKVIDNGVTGQLLMKASGQSVSIQVRAGISLVAHTGSAMGLA